MKPFSAAWWAARARYRDPGRPEPRARQAFLRLAAPVVRALFRPRIEGLEHLPDDRPFLLVANHSGGMSVAELLCLAALFFERDSPRIAPMAHPFSFALWPLTRIMRWAGAIPASYEAVHDTLERGVSVLMFPGGDYEAARPVWQWRRVDFNGRQGYLRIAREAGVPIVPMGIANSHLTVPVLWRSDFLLARLLVVPRLFGLKRFPLTLLGLLGAGALAAGAPPTLGWPLTALLIWAWLTSPLPLTPILPIPIRFRIGPPIPPESLFDGQDLAPAYAQVVGTIQDLVRPT